MNARKRPPLWRTLVATLALPLALLCSPTSAQGGASSPWGLRNVNWEPFGLDEWPAPLLAGLFQNHAPGYVNFWILWKQVELPSNAPLPPGVEPGCPPVPPGPSSSCNPYLLQYWGILDSGLAKARELGAIPVVGVRLDHPELILVAGNGGAQFSGPFDMNVADADLTAPIPEGETGGVHPGAGTYSGYSERLYFFARGMALAIKDFNAANPPPSNEVLMVVHPEAWDEWPLGSDESKWGLSLKSYVLSYLTVKQACEEVELQYPGVVDFKLSHGSIPRHRLLARKWFLNGENGGNQAKLLTKFQSLTERLPKALIELGQSPSMYGPGPTIDNWDEDVVYFASTDDLAGCEKAAVKNRQSDSWIAKLAEWTDAGYFEFSTHHSHGKPRWDDRERLEFDALLLNPLPWFITEAAFEVLDDNEDWVFNVEPWSLNGDPVRAQFVIEDYARKWCRFLAQDDAAAGAGDPVSPGDRLFGFCTPIVSGNNTQNPNQPPNYTGLHFLCGGGNPGCSGNAQPVLPTSLQRIDPHVANTAYQTVRNAIDVPLTSETLADTGHMHVRFAYGPGANQLVDVLWKNVLFDGDSSTKSVNVSPPSGFSTAEIRVLDSAGTWDTEPVVIVTTGTPPSEILRFLTLEDLGHAPKFVFWTP